MTRPTSVLPGDVRSCWNWTFLSICVKRERKNPSHAAARERAPFFWMKKKTRKGQRQLGNGKKKKTISSDQASDMWPCSHRSRCWNSGNIVMRNRSKYANMMFGHKCSPPARMWTRGAIIITNLSNAMRGFHIFTDLCMQVKIHRIVHRCRLGGDYFTVALKSAEVKVVGCHEQLKIADNSQLATITWTCSRDENTPSLKSHCLVVLLHSKPLGRPIFFIITFFSVPTLCEGNYAPEQLLSPLLSFKPFSLSSTAHLSFPSLSHIYSWSYLWYIHRVNLQMSSTWVNVSDDNLLENKTIPLVRQNDHELSKKYAKNKGKKFTWIKEKHFSH